MGTMVSFAHAFHIFLGCKVHFTVSTAFTIVAKENVVVFGSNSRKLDNLLMVNFLYYAHLQEWFSSRNNHLMTPRNKIWSCQSLNLQTDSWTENKTHKWQLEVSCKVHTNNTEYGA